MQGKFSQELCNQPSSVLNLSDLEVCELDKTSVSLPDKTHTLYKGIL